VGKIAKLSIFVGVMLAKHLLHCQTEFLLAQTFPDGHAKAFPNLLVQKIFQLSNYLKRLKVMVCSQRALYEKDWI
jgi:hypothetical protein